ITVSLPPGKHKWQWTTKLPIPLSPAVLGTENSSGEARLFYTASAGADHYRIEQSSDGGASWQTAGISKETSFVLRRLCNGEKLHVRIAACNAEQQSEPSAEYPIYVTDQPSLPPDGLRLKINDNCTSLTWGEVLGVAEYRLYRRTKGTEQYVQIYRGKDQHFIDTELTVPSPYPEPGSGPNAHHLEESTMLYEYTVSAVNGNGEGRKSIAVDTNPSSWLNWEPAGQDGRFKRRHTYMEEPYSIGIDVDMYYP
ncbi:MAG: hypothetical protein JWN30_2081, partial [Bacilli bacterium]|nr:hypothetical protein [Bacilli bacterium]